MVRAAPGVSLWEPRSDNEGVLQKPPHSRCGDPTKARSVLGWAPRVTFRELVKMMVEHDIDLARRERTGNEAGFVDPARGAATAASD
jgi:nucleoside-diphosphate-sugar epimerase